MPKARLQLTNHLTYEDLTRRFRTCRDGRQKARWQALWLLARPDQPLELLVWSLGWFRPGDELAITLPGDDADRHLGARIAYVTWQGGAWLLGCEFLTYPAAEDLELLSQGELVGSP